VTVRDAAGNQLIDPPVTWSVNPIGALTVSPTGLLEAHEEGFANVIASVGSLRDVMYVFISAQPAASVTVAPTQGTVAAGDTIMLAATVRDAAGRVINRPSVTWTSSDQLVATVAPSNAGTAGVSLGVVNGVSEGSVSITATSGAASDTVSIAVGPPRPVASVTVTPDPAMLVVQGTAQLAVTLRDASGRTISGPVRSVTWMSDNTAVATVDGNGLVRGVSLGSAAVIATSEGVSDTAAITVQQITLVAISAGGPDYFPRRWPPLDIPLLVGAHTCALTSDGTAYCWGGATMRWVDLPEDPDYGSSDGYYFFLDFSAPAAVAGDQRFVTLATGVGSSGRTADGTWYGWSARGSEYGENPQPLFYPADIVALSIPKAHEFQSYCSGNSCTGTFDYHVCGLTAGGAAYCWGANSQGQRGDGSTNRGSGPVAGGLTFSAVGVGALHTCGLPTTGIAYCWGGNGSGQLGDGSTSSSRVPIAVAGGLTFTALSVGTYGACALGTSGAAYCWGETPNAGTTPVAVGGGLSFVALSAGEAHYCGLAASGTAYCWGANSHGQLGDGSTINSSVPMAVVGGLTFSSLSAGSNHTCGLTTAGIAYCWGSNSSGQLGGGSGDTGHSSVPLKVAGQP